jgi:hypothetical protein
VIATAKMRSKRGGARKSYPKDVLRFLLCFGAANTAIVTVPSPRVRARQCAPHLLRKGMPR